MNLVVAVHALCVILLSVYALNQGILLFLFFLVRRRRAHAATSKGRARSLSSLSADLPMVTIQIPLFNERFVAERCIRAAAAQDYPAHRLQIQVLDDSTDDTTRIVQRAVESVRRAGLNIELVHRTDRAGFKAGALAAGLASAKGELIAIFDADFLPPPDFLRRIVCERRAFDDPCVGFVQTRWDYLNRESSLVTRAQAMTLDVHFMIEQPARNGNDLWINFNGSGGVWRRACIEDAGGWQSDTLTEDLDLSYRAEMRGWRGLYLEDQFSPGELPRDLLAYKRQQARWARGTLQTVRKLMPMVAASPGPVSRKLAAWMHLTGYFIHPLILLMTITTPLLLLHSLLTPIRTMLPMWVHVISLLSFAPMASMCVAHFARRRPLLYFVRDLPVALMIGVGISFSNSLAMVGALFDRRTGDWTPTPKMGRLGEAGAASTPRRSYALRPDWTMWIELGLALYVGVVVLVMLRWGYWLAVAPMLLYMLGFGGVWLNQLLNALQAMDG